MFNLINKRLKQLMTDRKALALLALIAPVSLGAWECGPPPLTQNSGFDLWCGSSLCAWQVPKGQIKRVPTWHSKDFGVQLVGPEVVLSQTITQPVTCFGLQMQLDKDNSVRVQFEMDFNDDGTTDYIKTITSDEYRLESHAISAPSWYSKVRVSVRKLGAGRAVLYAVKVSSGSACKEPPVPLNHRPLGAKCDTASQCKDSSCAKVHQWIHIPGDTNFYYDVCSACATDQDCHKGEVCGLSGGSKWGLFRACMAAGVKVMGERCRQDAECATGQVCCEGACSQCCGATGCTGATCFRRPNKDWPTNMEYQIVPQQCSPGNKIGQPGALCMLDSDCASGACDSAKQLKVCKLDGWTCTEDKDCVHGGCTTLGAAGGKCK